jgi:drug/metabolite transporter (DMT)-like permease
VGQRRFAAEAALVVAAFLFGVTFPLVQDALHDVRPFAFLALRFALAGACLAPFALLATRSRHHDLRAVLRIGVVSGALLFGGYAAQTVGLQYTTPSTSAFVTGLFVPLTPVVEAIWRRTWPQRRVVASVLLATLGLYLLTGADLAFGRGEALTLLGAVIFAAWLVYQGAHAPTMHPIRYATLQVVVLVGLALPATATEGLGELTPRAWVAIAFTGVACSGVALYLQIWAQRRVAPIRAALILLLEPVFAGCASFLDGERLGAVELAGAAVILGAIALSELRRRSPALAQR